MKEAGSRAEQILRILKRKGGEVTVRELCAELDLTPIAVSRHLKELEKNDLIFSETRKSGKGRPAKCYFLTLNGHESFERSYEELAIDILVNLRSSESKSKVDEVLESRRKERLERMRQRLAGKTLEARIHALTKFLTEEGYMAHWERVPPDGFRIKLMNCAVARVAHRFPQLCLSEERFIAEVLGRPVSRERYILQKDHYCSYLVKRSDGSSTSNRVES